jgi:hypothetical protein
MYHIGTERVWRYSSTVSLTSVLDGGGWLTPGMTRYTFHRRLGGPRYRSRGVREISFQPGFIILCTRNNTKGDGIRNVVEICYLEHISVETKLKFI